ncbi:hypothetical protein SAMN02745229_01403 [Butyrivibrio fibrisolvens DSM 3071]|uniref:Uncharacterized protein n=1 Tax=Butyrivibrio fibrisolvens DSM 3071 TaxID=1121131 RepID=A0A1M5XY71_BUTFI|nr:hypothetical protein [Butyrivibrio fibrisolvens]SHI04781.1 hypothetical protein SAMN02745229_01403 [Butyrivibrio fibrisolvens DSM 3071]
MAGINITSVNRQVKDISQEIYADKLQRDELQAKSVNKDESSGLQNAVAEKLSDKSNINTAFSDTAATLSISALGAEELEKVRDSWNNHPVSALYEKDIPVSKNAEGVYKIGGASFNDEELSAARDLITGVGSQLKKGYLSYRDYAKMEVAQKVVDECASKGFNEDQAKAISKAMKDYNNNLVRTQERLLANKKTKTNDDTTSGKYFGIEVHVPNEVRKSTNEYASTDIATNQDLIANIRDNIRSTTLSDKNAVNKLIASYEDIMRPAYNAQYPAQLKSNVDDVISRDVNDLIKLFDFSEKWKR